MRSHVRLYLFIRLPIQLYQEAPLIIYLRDHSSASSHSSSPSIHHRFPSSMSAGVFTYPITGPAFTGLQANSNKLFPVKGSVGWRRKTVSNGSRVECMKVSHIDDQLSSQHRSSFMYWQHRIVRLWYLWCCRRGTRSTIRSTRRYRTCRHCRMNPLPRRSNTCSGWGGSLALSLIR